MLRYVLVGLMGLFVLTNREAWCRGGDLNREGKKIEYAEKGHGGQVGWGGRAFEYPTLVMVVRRNEQQIWDCTPNEPFGSKSKCCDYLCCDDNDDGLRWGNAGGGGWSWPKAGTRFAKSGFCVLLLSCVQSRESKAVNKDGRDGRADDNGPAECGWATHKCVVTI